ncbi:MAG: AAA domain-containing protein [bacterium]|nr:AAA domain-containing protein [bacterium]
MNAQRELGERLTREVLEPMKSMFVGKDEVIDLLAVSLVAGENIFLLGPPGTAKSALVHELGRRLQGRTFEYLLTRFTEPNELFGPFDIRRLREGELVTNTEGMLPEASLVFLDELLNANSAILNSLLTCLNERVFRRGRETRDLPTLMVVGASNHLPEEDALAALFDRFLLRVRCENVEDDRLSEVLDAGWRLEMGQAGAEPSIDIEDVRRLHAGLGRVDLDPIRTIYRDVILRLRRAGFEISDRRAVKLQRPIAASALLCGRDAALVSDLWVLRYVWDTDEQREVLSSIVQDALGDSAADESAHRRARRPEAPDPEQLARDLELIEGRVRAGELSDATMFSLRDRLGIIAGRCEWVRTEDGRGHLKERVAELWKAFGE